MSRICLPSLGRMIWTLANSSSPNHEVISPRGTSPASRFHVAVMGEL